MGWGEDGGVMCVCVCVSVGVLVASAGEGLFLGIAQLYPGCV